MFVFNKGYICCGCRERTNDVHVKYKNVCICNKCYGELDITNNSFVMHGTKDTEFLLSAFEYKSTYREIFLNFKFNGEYAAGHLIGMMLENYFKDVNYLDVFDCIIPIPISKKRFAKRGYNQAEILAKYVSKALNIPIINSLKRVKHNKSQTTLIGNSRSDNVKNAFEVSQNIEGLNILLFDDIVTTGSTVNECAKILKAAGAVRVAVLSSSFARKYNKK